MRRMIATATFAFTFALTGISQAQQLSRPTVSEMTESEREAFRSEVRAYLLEHPEVLMEAINILEDRRRENSQQADAELIVANSKQLYSDPNSWVLGNPDGDVTVVEFSDYRCGYCKKAHPEILELLQRDPNVRLVVKEFPILGPDSIAAARMAMAALDIDPARFVSLNDALMSFDGQLSEAIAYQIAGREDYDIDALKQRAASSDIDERIEANYTLARALGLQGTPGFIIGDQIIRGYIPIDDMLAAVAEARAATN